MSQANWGELRLTAVGRLDAGRHESEQAHDAGWVDALPELHARHHPDEEQHAESEQEQEQPVGVAERERRV
jgi:hypothetical protein